jgi:single-strand DNA-binding protein
MGRVTSDIEVKDAGSAKVANFSLAVRRRFQRDGQSVTDFVPCVVWNKLAETMAQHVSKGQQILIEGDWENDSYTDKEGKKRDKWIVRVSNFEFAGPKPGSAASGGDVIADDDEIPFA